MATSLVARRPEVSRRSKYFYYEVTFSGTYATGGDTVNFLAATNPERHPRALLPAQPLPTNGSIEVMNEVGGYSFTFKQNGSSPTIQNFLCQIYTTAATELAAGAYPAGIASAPQPLVIRVRSKNFN